MAAHKRDPIQKLKEQIIKMPLDQQNKLFAWLEAVRDVNVENARREAAKTKEGSTT